MQDTVIAKTVKDFFTGKFLFMSLAPFVVPILVLGGFFIYGSSELITMLQDGASSGDFSYIDEKTYPTIAYILGFTVVHWLIMSLFVVFGTLGTVLLSLIIAVITVGLLTPVIVSSVRNRHYGHIESADGDSFLFSLWTIFKIFLKFIVLFLCTLPFLLLPFINFMIFQLPFFYLFYRLMTYDLLSTGVSKDAPKIMKENRVYLFVVMVIFFFLSLIPLFGLLLQVLFVIYLSHFILSKSNSTVYNSSTTLDIA
ncbi:MAG: hypothetical protein DRG78_23345 [Epsilonproteobacteria bacterium]|nr:MAG: hypothetical protein DRG78_23345 [Campylobacterota bacterium]